MTCGIEFNRGAPAVTMVVAMIAILSSCAALPSSATATNPSTTFVAVSSSVAATSAKTSMRPCDIIGPMRTALAPTGVISPVSVLPPQRVASIAARLTTADAQRQGNSLSFSYSPQTVYALDVAAGSLADLMLDPHETLITIAGSDTSRWSVAPATGGGRPPRTHILIKPVASQLTTYLVILTDKRAYRLQLRSIAPHKGPSSIMTVVGFSPITTAQRHHLQTSPSSPQSFRKYHATADNPATTPDWVRDDGHQLIINMASSFDHGDAPPLFLVGPRGSLQLLNFRLLGRSYIIDRLFDHATVQFGTDRHNRIQIDAIPEEKNHD